MSEVDRYISDIAHQYGLTYAAMRGVRGTRDVADVRRKAIWAVKARWPYLSLRHIGRKFNRTHATIHHALREQQ